MTLCDNSPVIKVRRKDVLVRYGMGFATAAAASAIAIFYRDSYLSLTPFLLFYAAVAVSSWFGGAGPGIVAILIGVVVAGYFLLPSHITVVQSDFHTVARVTLFMLVGLLIALLNGALRRATRRWRIESELAQKSEARSQQLALDLQHAGSQVMIAEERERRRIATLLHDSVVQMLGLSKLKINRLSRLVEDERVKESLADISQLVESAMAQTRTLTAELSPPVLNELGLAAAVQWLGERMQRDHGVAVSQNAEENKPLDLSEEAQVVLFQAVRELLANVVKHAGASHCRVQIAAADAKVRVAVADDGIGLEKKPSTDYSSGGFGLFNIRQRVSHLGGTFSIERTEPRGTRIEIVVPATQQQPPVEVKYERADSSGRRSPANAAGTAADAGR
jgi:signal transduction histidine kinase